MHLGTKKFLKSVFIAILISNNLFSLDATGTIVLSCGMFSTKQNNCLCGVLGKKVLRNYLLFPVYHKSNLMIAISEYEPIVPCKHLRFAILDVLINTESLSKDDI